MAPELEFALSTPSPVHVPSPLSALGCCHNGASQEASGAACLRLKVSCMARGLWFVLWGARLESSFVNEPRCAGGIATASSLSRPRGGTFGVSRAGLASLPPQREDVLLSVAPLQGASSQHHPGDPGLALGLRVRRAEETSAAAGGALAPLRAHWPRGRPSARPLAGLSRCFSPCRTCSVDVSVL